MKLRFFTSIYTRFQKTNPESSFHFQKQSTNERKIRNVGNSFQTAKKSGFQTNCSEKTSENRHFKPEKQVFHKAHMPYYHYY